MNIKSNYKEGFPIHMEVHNVKFYPWHYHDDIQIIYVLKGSVFLKIAQRQRTLTAGDFHIIQPDDIHGFHDGSPDNEILIITLKTSYLSSVFPRIENAIFSSEMQDTSINIAKKESFKELLFKTFFDFTIQKKDSIEFATKSANDIITFIQQNFSGYLLNDEYILEHRVPYDSFQEERIKRIVAFIYENYSSKISLEELAKDESVNPYYLSHIIHRYTGKSFRELLGALRAECSEILVLSTDYSISKIANDVGFSSYTYFVKYFKNFFGQEPLEYRKNYSKFILGNMDPDIKNINSSFINSFEKKYAEKYTDTLHNKSIIIDFGNSFHLSSEMKTKTSNFALDVIPILKKKSNNSTIDYRNIYKNMSPTKFLNKFLDSPDGTRALTLIDSNGNSKGLYTSNGLIKPLYYIYGFIKDLYQNIVSESEIHLLTSDRNQYNLLVFNPYKHPIDVSITFQNMDGCIKIQKRILSPDNSCFKLWEQLNFSTLSENEIELINNATCPTLSYQLFSDLSNKKYFSTINYDEIVQLEISATKNKDSN